MAENAFETGRTFGPVSEQEAEEILDVLLDAPNHEIAQTWRDLLKLTLIGGLPPRFIPNDFQSLAETIFERIQEFKKESARQDRSSYEEGGS